MNGIEYLIAITHSDYIENYIDFFKGQGVKSVIYDLCLGTAKEKIMNVLGLTHKEKFMLQMMVRNEDVPPLLEGLNRIIETGGGADNGVAFTIPIDAIGGETCKKFFLGEDSKIEKGEKKMKQGESKCVLIITVVDKGNTDLVMDAAREAGASGGTVVKAKGTGAEIAKVFGMTISEEKEMIYIVSDREKKK